MDLSSEPVFVVEESACDLDSIMEKAKNCHRGHRFMLDVKRREFCPDRWMLSSPRVYFVRPSETQVSFVFVSLFSISIRLLTC